MDAKRAVGTIIGIDPDIGKNGVATIRRESRCLSLQSLNFPETVEYIKSEFEAAKNAAIPFALYIEAGWLNKGNWHVTQSRNGKFSPSAWAAAVGQSAGECHAVSKKLIECCEYYGVPATPVKPYKKCWKGPDRKITHAELQKEADLYRINFKAKRSNQEERDAALFALFNL